MKIHGVVWESRDSAISVLRVLDASAAPPVIITFTTFNLRARERKERRAEALSIRALTRRCTFVSSPSAAYDDKLAR